MVLNIFHNQDDLDDSNIDLTDSPLYLQVSESGLPAPSAFEAAATPSVLISSGGITFNLLYDAAAMANAAFRAGIEQAAFATVTNHFEQDHRQHHNPSCRNGRRGVCQAR